MVFTPADRRPASCHSPEGTGLRPPAGRTPSDGRGGSLVELATTSSTLPSFSRGAPTLLVGACGSEQLAARRQDHRENPHRGRPRALRWLGVMPGRLRCRWPIGARILWRWRSDFGLPRATSPLAAAALARARRAGRSGCWPRASLRQSGESSEPRHAPPTDHRTPQRSARVPAHTIGQRLPDGARARPARARAQARRTRLRAVHGRARTIQACPQTHQIHHPANPHTQRGPAHIGPAKVD